LIARNTSPLNQSLYFKHHIKGLLTDLQYRSVNNFTGNPFWSNNASLCVAMGWQWHYSVFSGYGCHAGGNL